MNNNTNKSSLIAGYLFNASVNFWTIRLLTDAIPDQPMSQFDTALFVIVAFVVALAAVILIIRTKGQLGCQLDMTHKTVEQKPTHEVTPV